jgi:DNA invertase Pin-like site-specific DNA recombinase
MARALKAIRLNRCRKEDPTVSPDVQEKNIDKWIADSHHTPLKETAADLDVSAYKVGPFARPQLGKWLIYRKSEFDLVVWARLDRAIRNMADMSDLVRWAKEDKETLVFVQSETSLNASTAVERLTRRIRIVMKASSLTSRCEHSTSLSAAWSMKR